MIYDVLMVEVLGKILYELCSGMFFLFNEGVYLLLLYYGMVDVMLLWICLLVDVCDVGMLLLEVCVLFLVFCVVFIWMIVYGDVLGSGFIDYKDELGYGFVN